MSRGYSCVGLHRPKNNLNVGSVLRAAACYDVSLVVATERGYRKSPTDTPKAYRHIPFIQCDDLHPLIPYDCIPVAVDIVDGAESLCNFEHPERAFYIFGPEDGTLGESVLSWCPKKIVVPTKFCMNLAATVNVVLYDRLCKKMNPKESPDEN